VSVSIKTKKGMNVAAYRRGSGRGLVYFLTVPFYNALQYRELIRVVLGRELYQRFRASYFGWIWAVATPLLMLLVFTAVSTNILKIGGDTEINFALSMFIGLLYFNLFAELLNRAPLLLSEHVNFIKKSIFPSEILAWTSMLRSLTYAGIGFVVYLAFQLYIVGIIPLTALLLPFILLPLFLFLLGMVWFFSALGAFTRDISFMVAAVMPIFIFVTPVFYSVIGQPLEVQLTTYINPLAPYVEMTREILLLGRLPDLMTFLIAWGVAVVVFYGGYSFFMRFRSVAVDVI
jgi:lipopolysaccharide transport system permease protein